ncbi:class I SAM-dependent methyltransferase [Pedobacter aquatilis]|uniref:class I SAM-dependent methyltransferase n=1 Tax=Pedobacter aquatilis TaxID=351343 RepID=UPI0025B40419|nr:class I SAM-dependent methyltransferase [Pedobacter aquatilis]MDN3587266.1 class I SAM-dependent methyltransferase [Pedobacter aquatilis]
MINITCPLCLNDKTQLSPVRFEIKAADGRYFIKTCQNCGHNFSWFNHEVDIQSYYDDKDYTVQDTRRSIFYKIQQVEYKAVLKKILSFKNIPATILDFGSGKGLFLQFAKEQGFNVKGIESSVPRAEYARKYFDVDINTDYYKSGSVFNKKFDVLTLFHVLEHIHLSDSLLQNLIQGNLKDDGLLVIEVPNFSSWQSKWAGNKWLHLDVPRHISHFTPKILKKLIEDNDFQVKSSAYFSLHLGIIGMVQTMFSWFGYKGFLIADLKRKKTLPLMLGLMFVLPFAILLELTSAMFESGGIIRFYAVKRNHLHK